MIAAMVIMRIKVPMALMAVLAVAAIAVLLVPVLYIRDTVASFDGATISVKGAVADVSVPTTKLKSVELRDQMEFGDIEKAASNGYKISGKFRNKEFGEYTVSVNIDEKKYIVVRYGGSVLVFNLKTAEETEAFYLEIKDSVPSHGRTARWHKRTCRRRIVSIRSPTADASLDGAQPSSP